MDIVLRKLIEQLNSSVFILFAVLGVVIYGVYKLGKWTELFKHHDAKICKSEENYDKFSEVVKELKIKMDLVYQNTNPNRMVQAHSPISITQQGNEVSEVINAPQILQAHISELVSHMDEDKPHNAYDIQMSAMRVAKYKMIDMLTDTELTVIKQEAYNRGILVEDVMSIFGVLLRNHVLIMHGMSVAQVDEHEPE